MVVAECSSYVLKLLICDTKQTLHLQHVTSDTIYVGMYLHSEAQVKTNSITNCKLIIVIVVNEE